MVRSMLDANREGDFVSEAVSLRFTRGMLFVGTERTNTLSFSPTV